MATFYWVGDGGDWTDSAHWSASSGGAGGFGVPGATDDVVWDASSFPSTGQTVDANLGGGTDTIQSFDGTSLVNGPVLHLSGVSLKIIGTSFVSVGPFTVNSISESVGLEFTAVGGTFVFGTSSDVVLDVPITVQESANTVQLFSDIFMSGHLLLIGGNFDCATFEINASAFHFVATTTGTSVNMRGRWNVHVKPGIGSPTDATAFWDEDIGTGTLVMFANSTSINVEFLTYSNVNQSRKFVVCSSVDGPGFYGSMSFLGDNTNANLVDFTFAASAEFHLGNTFILDQPPITLRFDPSGILDIAELDATGVSGKLVTMEVLGSVTISLIVQSAFVQFVAAQGLVTTGAAIPIDDTNGGVDNGQNTHWLFTPAPPAPPNSVSQNVFFVGSDLDGTVQMMNVGKADNGTPIYYELETQELEFGSRAHLKGISDQIAVFTKFGAGGNLQAYTDTQSVKEIDMQFNDRVNLGKNIDLEGHYVTFRWFGASSTASPVLIGLYLESVFDKGMVKP